MPLQPHELTIKIINNKKSGAGSASAPTAESGGKAVETAQDAIGAAVVARELRALASQAVSYTVSSVSITTGNTISQERMEYAMGAATKLAAYGLALGTGNVVAAAFMALHDGISILSRAGTFELRNNVERESLALSRDRAGVAFNQSRMGAAK